VPHHHNSHFVLTELRGQAAAATAAAVAVATRVIPPAVMVVVPMLRPLLAVAVAKGEGSLVSNAANPKSSAVVPLHHANDASVWDSGKFAHICMSIAEEGRVIIVMQITTTIVGMMTTHL